MRGKEKQGFTKSLSIRTRVMLFLVMISMMIIIPISYLGMKSVYDIGEYSMSMSSQGLAEKFREHMTEITEENVVRSEFIMGEVSKEIRELALHAQQVFDNPAVFAPGEYWAANQSMITRENGVYMNDREETSSVFVPDFAERSDELIADIETGAYLDFIVPGIMNSMPDLAAAYFCSETESTRYYPDIRLGDFVSPNFTVTERPWYVKAAPESNPHREVVWTDVYLDATGKGLMVTASAPVYTRERGFIGVVGFDLDLSQITEYLEDSDIMGSGYFIMIDREGNSMVLPREGYLDVMDREPTEGEFGTNLSGAVPEFLPVLEMMQQKDSGFMKAELGGSEHYVAFSVMNKTGWIMASIVESADILGVVDALVDELSDSANLLVFQGILPLGGIMMVIAMFVGIVFTNAITTPLRRLQEGVSQVMEGRFRKVEVRTRDEIGELCKAFNRMTVKLRESQRMVREHERGLEDQVKERTRELDSKVKELEDTTAAVINMMEDVDMTNKDLMDTQARLRKSLEKIRVMDKKKDEFISVAAHELKTPLTAIHGFSQLLMNRKVAGIKSKRDNYLRIMDKETGRLSKLVTDILELSRIDLGTIRIAPESVDLEEIYNTVKDEMGMVSQRKKSIIFEAEMQKDLPSIRTDREKLTQVLLNLTNNAFKYTDKGKVSLEVKRKGRFINFSVSDTGVGIPKSEQEKIFDRFYQVDSSYTRSAGGTGLGLAISREYIELLGGEIWVESHVGKGTVFRFTVPIDGPPRDGMKKEERKARQALKESEDTRKMAAQSGLFEKD